MLIPMLKALCAVCTSASLASTILSWECGWSVFQDEVTLVMRQDSEIRPVLDIIEEDEMYLKITEIYQSSRLADLSRPAELREVDMDILGVTEYFLSDTLMRIWTEAVPDAVKHLMVPLYDEFVKGYCLYRAMGENADTTIANGESFTRAVQKSMIVSCSMMFCLKMKDMPKWKFIMDGSQLIIEMDTKVIWMI